jgi:hypothetical protein
LAAEIEDGDDFVVVHLPLLAAIATEIKYLSRAEEFA